ncbi:PAS domain-containing sensor histidine kinase [Clostridium pasteurianum]|uniref:sensor histidine kinase n=1 Tax=Clostridium pasteurianum TaxID=1501 RepID=UPI0022608745|nr:PAS domain-containing sensor histidine kinase [Clostridium pasteurianum]UZW15377.1 PAS domain-containing sensor histidine kinase [Clostridium pasteurianum]
MKYTLKKSKKAFLYTKDDIAVEVNDDFMDITGYSKEELLGKSIEQIIDLLRISSFNYNQNLNEEYSYYFVTKLDKVKKVNISFSLLEKDERKKYYFDEKNCFFIEDKVSFMEKIWTKDQGEFAIWESENLIMLQCSEGFSSFFRLSHSKKENYIGKNIKEIENKVSDISKVLKKAIDTGKAQMIKESRHTFNSEESYWNFNMIPITIKGKVKYIIQTCSNITEKVLREKIIKEQNIKLIQTQYDFFNTMINNLDLPVIRLSYPDFKIKTLNHKGYILLKRLKPEIENLEKLKGIRCANIYDNFDEKCLLSHIKNILENKDKFGIRKRFVVSGEETFMNMVHYPLIDIDGKVLEIIQIAVDVTEEIRTNNKVEKSLRIQQEVFANISHELRTPLNVIFSAIQLFQLYLNKDNLNENKNKIINNLYIVKQNCYRLSRFVNNIVDLAKIEAGNFKLNLCNENIVNLIKEIVKYSVKYSVKYIKFKGVNIVFNTNVKEKIIACDSYELARAILNLISNAIKFSHNKSEIYVELVNKNKTVEISVADNGMGIDKNYYDIIFHKFKQIDKSFTRNAEGSGMGLYIAKSIIEMHSGKISVESKIGKGSKFKVELPSKILKNNHENNNHLRDNLDMINMEFSDIYSS